MSGLQILRSDCARILVIGTSCAGKSTFARELTAGLALPYIELDELYWSPNWMPKAEAEFLRLADEATAGPSWIIDGNYHSVRDLLWPRATHVIWLNYSFPIVMTRAMRRTLRRVVNKEVLWHGNRESLRRAFLSKDSILLWVLTTFRRRRRTFEQLRATARYPNLEWIEFRRPEDAKRFLELHAANSSQGGALIPMHAKH